MGLFLARFRLAMNYSDILQIDCDLNNGAQHGTDSTVSQKPLTPTACICGAINFAARQL